MHTYQVGETVVIELVLYDEHGVAITTALDGNFTETLRVVDGYGIRTPVYAGPWSHDANGLYHAEIVGAPVGRYTGVIVYAGPPAMPFGWSAQVQTRSQYDPASVIATSAGAGVAAQLVGVPVMDVLILRDNAGTAITGKTLADFATAEAYQLDQPTVTAAVTLVEIGGGEYRVSFIPTTTQTWGLHLAYAAAGVAREFLETYEVVTASQFDPVAALTTVTVELISPLAPDGGTLRLIQGDSYAAAQSRQLAWNLTGQPDLTGAIVTITIVAGETVTKPATLTNPAGGAPTITATLTVAETAILSPAKVGTFDLSAAIGVDMLTLVRGRVYVESDVP